MCSAVQESARAIATKLAKHLCCCSCCWLQESIPFCESVPEALWPFSLRIHKRRDVQVYTFFSGCLLATSSLDEKRAGLQWVGPRVCWNRPASTEVDAFDEAKPFGFRKTEGARFIGWPSSTGLLQDARLPRTHKRSSMKPAGVFAYSLQI